MAHFKKDGLFGFTLDEDIPEPKVKYVNNVAIEEGGILLVGGYKGTGKTHWLIKGTKTARGKKYFLSLEMSEGSIMKYLKKYYTDEERLNNNDLVIMAGKSVKLSTIKKMFQEKGHPNYVEWMFIDKPEAIYDDRTECGYFRPHEHEISVFTELDQLCEKYGTILVTTRQINPDGRDNPGSQYFSGSKEINKLADVVVILRAKEFKIEHSRCGQSMEYKSWYIEPDNDDGEQMDFLEDRNEVTH